MALLREMAAAGRTIVFSSHILEEVERLSDNVLVIVAGRLAASGDFHAIRRLMTDHPHTFTLRSSDDRRLGAALVADPSVLGVELTDGGLSVRTSDFGAFALAAPRVAHDNRRDHLRDPARRPVAGKRILVPGEEMNSAIFVLTLRQLLGKRRALFMIALAALPLLAAVIFRFSDAEMTPQRWTAEHLFKGLIVTIILPLVTLVFGTTALGMEIEDGTVVYLLAKPLRRFDVIGAKLAAAWLPAALLLLLSTLISAGIALGGGNSSIIVGFAVAVVLGSLAYCSVFMAASVFTNHSLDRRADLRVPVGGRSDEACSGERATSACDSIRSVWPTSSPIRAAACSKPTSTG